jgi:hypothetical protein
MRGSSTRPASFPGLVTVGIPAGLFGICWYFLELSRTESAAESLTGRGEVIWSGPTVAMALAGAVTLLYVLLRSAIAISERRRQLAYPMEPWRWRRRWQDGVVANDTRAMAATSLFWMVIVLGFASFIGFQAVVTLTSGSSEGIGVVLLLTLVMTAAIVVVGRQSLRAAKTWRRWQGHHLSLLTVPGRPGSTLRGRLSVPVDTRGTQSLNIKFGVYRSRSTPKNRVIPRQGTPLWESGESTRSVPLGASTLDLEFEVPRSRPNSDWSKNDEKIRWQITVSDDLGEEFYYEVPVFA